MGGEGAEEEEGLTASTQESVRRSEAGREVRVFQGALEKSHERWGSFFAHQQDSEGGGREEEEGRWSQTLQPGEGRGFKRARQRTRKAFIVRLREIFLC